MLLTVGDGHGNAAVVSIVRVGFRSAAQAQAFQRIEDTPGSGDVRPLDIAVGLGITGVTLTAMHYHSRLDGSAVVVAEAETATGHIDGQLLDAIADTATYLPIR
jgi:fructose-specific component phosphotransferase system IIB-like protein